MTLHPSDYELGLNEGEDADGFTKEFRSGKDMVLKEELTPEDENTLRSIEKDAVKDVTRLVIGE